VANHAGWQTGKESGRLSADGERDRRKGRRPTYQDGGGSGWLVVDHVG
jgi:hypothetical protein